MISYAFQTYEGCVINVDVQGQHVAAGLDSLLSAKQGDWHRGPGGDGPKSGLLVPFLVDALIVRLVTMKAIEICRAAGAGGCMPGMIMEALVKIKGRALFWHQKALKYEAQELKRQGLTSERQDKQIHADDRRAHGDADQETPSVSHTTPTETAGITSEDPIAGELASHGDGKAAAQKTAKGKGATVRKRRNGKKR
jgi:hypothetical protein